MIANKRKVANFILYIFCIIFLSCSNFINNYTPDHRSEPSISILNLVNYQLLISPIVVNGTAYDKEGIVNIKILINGSVFSAETSDNWKHWTFDLNTASLITGEHTIAAIATNLAGQETTVSLKFFYRDGIDLEPVKIDTTGTFINRQTLELEGTLKIDVRNNSAYDIKQSYSIYFFEDHNNNSVYDKDIDLLFGSIVIPAGHKSQTIISAQLFVKTRILFADNLIYAFIDAENEVDETNENNNIIHSMTGVIFQPPVGSFDPVLKWQWTGSSINPESNQVMCSPVVSPLIDNNSDGKIDSNDIPYIIFNTFKKSNYLSNGTLRAIRGDGKGELFAVTDYYTEPISNPAVGDLDNDGKPDIIAIENSYKLMAINNDGSLKWLSSYVLPGGVKSIAIADIDQDGIPEIIVGKYVFNNDGTLRWIGDNPDSSGNMTSSIASLVFGEKPFVVSGNSAFYYDGSLFWKNDDVANGFTAVADINSDGFPNIVVVLNGKAWLLRHDGSLLWGPVDLPSGGGGPPTIADVDGDGSPDIGIACAEHFVVLNADGSIKWYAPTRDNSSKVTGSSVFDFDGDGSAELVYADEHYLRIYKGSDGSELFKTEVGSGTMLEIPIVVDVDNDNKSEIVVVANNYWNPSFKTGILVFGDANDTWVNTRKIWNQHAYHITNVNDDASIPQFEIDNWTIFNNYRQNQILNPFEAVDLSSSYLRVNNSAYPASAVITARVGNSGAIFIATSFFVSLYDGDPDAGGLLIATQEVAQRLDPGSYVDIQFIWASPSNGVHDIYVVADDDGTGKSRLREVSKSNNKISLTAEFIIH